MLFHGFFCGKRQGKAGKKLTNPSNFLKVHFESIILPLLSILQGGGARKGSGQIPDGSLCKDFRMFKDQWHLLYTYYIVHVFFLVFYMVFFGAF